MQKPAIPPMLRQAILVSSLPHLDADPTDLDEAEVEANLAAYLSLWHPEVLARCEHLPRWAATYELYDDLDRTLLFVPPPTASTADPEWESRAVGVGALVVPAGTNLMEDYEILAKQFETPIEDTPDSRTFLALGLGRLWWAIITSHLGREEGLDTAAFEDSVLRAARAEASAERTENLDKALGLLQAARDRIYPVEIYTLPLVYVRTTPDEDAMAPFLEDSLPFNLVVTAKTLELLGREKPGLLERLKALIQTGRCELVGGEWIETRHPLLPLNALLHSLCRGLRSYEKHLNRRPEAYGRRTFGLGGYLPQILNRVNIYYALHFSMDGASFPEHYEPRIRWEGLATSSVQALTRMPYNLSDPRDVLAYGRAVAQTIASDHVATTSWAYDPADPAVYAKLAAILARLTPAFGRWYTLTQYFQTTEPVDMSVHPADDEYRSVYLLRDHVRQLPHPVTRYQTHWREHGLLFSASVLDAVARTLRWRGPELGQLDGAVYLEDGEPEPLQLAEAIQERATAIAHILSRAAADAPAKLLILNPSADPVRIPVPEHTEGTVPVRPLGVPFTINPVERQVQAAYRGIAEVPAFGYSCVEPASANVDMPVTVTERDEVLELNTGLLSATIDRQTGALKGLGRPDDRLPRLAVRLCARGIPAEAPADSADPYVTGNWLVNSRMAAYRVHVLQSGPALAEVVTEGILVGDPPPAASPSGLITRFRISYQAVGGSDILRLACELWDFQEAVFADGSPWTEYVGMTLAWPDPATAIVRGTGALRSPTRKQRFEAPAFIELHDPPRCTAVLTGGLPFLVRTHGRMADLILVTRTEKARFFEIAIALDPHNPYHTLATLLSPPVIVPLGKTTLRGPDSGWFFHVDAQNVSVVELRSLDLEGRKIRLRLLETAGQPTRTRIRSWRPIEAAYMTDFLGEVLFQADAAEDYVDIDVLAHELVEVHVHLK